MDDLRGMRGKPTAHMGHLAALGAKLALMLSEKGIRHTAMTREHLLWSETDGGLRLISWGNAVKTQWPGEARAHAADLRVFRDHFGLSMAAGLRLGYVYHLGPIAEWIFYDLAGVPSELARFGDLPAALTEQWPPPSSDMSLGENSELSKADATIHMNLGISFRKQGNGAAAKRSFLRCYLAGLAAQERQIALASILNLGNVFRDEGRFVRAYGLCLMAIMLAKDGKGVPMEFVGSLLVDLASKVPQADQDAMKKIVDECSSLPELMWRWDDYEIRKIIRHA